MQRQARPTAKPQRARDEERARVLAREFDSIFRVILAKSGDLVELTIDEIFSQLSKERALLSAGSGYTYTHESHSPEAAVPQLFRMDEAQELIKKLAALLPEERREAYRAKALVDFEAAAGLTSPEARQAPHIATATSKAKSRTRLGPTSEAVEKSSRRKLRHLFSEEELHDPKTIDRARDTLADIESARNARLPVPPDLREAGRRASALLRRVRQLNAA